MRYHYTLEYTYPMSLTHYCVLTSDMNKIEKAIEGHSMGNVATSDVLLSAEQMFELQKTLDKGTRLSVKDTHINNLNYWADLANLYPNKTIAELKEMGF